MDWLKNHEFLAAWVSAVFAGLGFILGVGKILSFRWLTNTRLILGFLVVGLFFEIFAASSPFVSIGMRIVAGIGALLCFTTLLLFSLPDN